MDTTMHQVQVELRRKDATEPIIETVKFHGEDYDTFTEAEAVRALMPNGTHSERVVLLDGFVVFGGHMIPPGEFLGLSTSIVAKSRPE